MLHGLQSLTVVTNPLTQAPVMETNLNIFSTKFRESVTPFSMEGVTVTPTGLTRRTDVSTSVSTGSKKVRILNTRSRLSTHFELHITHMKGNSVKKS